MKGDSESNRTESVLLYIESIIKFEVIVIDICDSNW